MGYAPGYAPGYAQDSLPRSPPVFPVRTNGIYHKYLTYLVCQSAVSVRTYLNTVLPCTALYQYLLPCTTVHDPEEIGFSIWYSVRMPLHRVQRGVQGSRYYQYRAV